MKTVALRVAVAAILSGWAVAAGAAGISYDCDTAPGHFSDLTIPVTSATFTVTGNIQLVNAASDPKWAALSRIRIVEAPASVGTEPADFGGFELTAVAGEKVKSDAKLVQMFLFDKKGQDPESIQSSLQPAPAAAAPFKLSYDGLQVKVDVAGETRSFPMTLKNPAVEIVCSTAEFQFTDLEIAATH